MPQNLLTKNRRPAASPDTHADSASLTYSDVRWFFRRYGTAVAGAGIVAAVIALIVASRVTPTYLARAQILIESRLPQALREQLGEATLALDSPAIESQIAILKSDLIAGGVIAKLEMTKDPELISNTATTAAAPFWRYIWGGIRPETGDLDALTQVRTTEAFHNRLEVRRAGLSYVLEVSYRSRDPVQAARVVNAIADVYLTDQVSQKADAARQASDWREEQIGKMRAQMNRASRSVQEFKARRDYRLLPRESAEVDAKEVGGIREHETREPITLEELEVTSQAYRKVYENNLQVHADLVQRQFLQFSNARVISRASVPAVPDAPRTKLIALMSGIAGVMLAVAVSLAHNIFDQRISCRRDVELGSGLVCLAEIGNLAAPLTSGGLSRLLMHQSPSQSQVSLIDVARLQGAIERRSERSSRQIVAIVDASPSNLGAKLAVMLAENCRNLDVGAVVVADVDVVHQLTGQKFEVGSIGKLSKNAAGHDVMTLPLDRSAMSKQVEAALISKLQPYRSIFYLVSANSSGHYIVPLLGEASTNLIVAERFVTTSTEIRAGSSVLVASPADPPVVVIMDGGK